MEKHLVEAEEAFKEIVEMINEATEMGQFNDRYFEKPFKHWYARIFDRMQSMTRHEFVEWEDACSRCGASKKLVRSAYCKLDKIIQG